MSEVKIERYAVLQVISDEMFADNQALAAAKAYAPDDWRRAVAREGYQPVADPEVHVDRAAFPQWVTDPETGEEVKLPDQMIRVVGPVVPDSVPLPPDFVYDPLPVRYRP